MTGGKACLSQLLVTIILVVVGPVISAPYLKTATGDTQTAQKQQPPLDHLFKPSQGLIGPLFRHNDYSLHPPTSGGCYYQFRNYEEGDRIITNEPCLNCTCHNSMLMCYLKVCPFSKPIGQDCTVKKSSNQCCPVITCPQVPVNLQVMQMSSTTTVSPASSSTTALVPYTKHGCTIDDQYYPDGAQIPRNPDKPCEVCYCIRNHTTCLMQECVLKVQGCEPMFEVGFCCPVRYVCEHDEYEDLVTTTTVAPNGTLLTTTIQPPQYIGGCVHNDEFYADGAVIPSEDPCKHCYCMKTDIMCAIQECSSPLTGEDENCKPRAPPPGQCCPEAYDCPTEEAVTISPILSSRPDQMIFITGHREQRQHEADAPTMILKDQEVESKLTTLPDIAEITTALPGVVTKSDVGLFETEYPESLTMETRTTHPDIDIKLTTRFTDVETDELTTAAEAVKKDTTKPDITKLETKANETTRIVPSEVVPETTETPAVDISEPIFKVEKTTEIYIPFITQTEESVIPQITLTTTPDSVEEEVKTDKTTILETDLVTKPSIKDTFDVEKEKDSTLETEIVNLESDKVVTTLPTLDIMETKTEKTPVPEIDVQTYPSTKKVIPTMLEQVTLKEATTKVSLLEGTFEPEYEEDAATKRPTTDISDFEREKAITTEIPLTDITLSETDMYETTIAPISKDAIDKTETEFSVTTKSTLYITEPEDEVATIKSHISDISEIHTKLYNETEIDSTTETPIPETEKPSMQILQDQFIEEEISDYKPDPVPTSYPLEFVTKSSVISDKSSLTTAKEEISDVTKIPFNITTEALPLEKLSTEESTTISFLEDQIITTASPLSVTDEEELSEIHMMSTTIAQVEEKAATKIPGTTFIAIMPEKTTKKTYPPVPEEPDEYHTTQRPEDFVLETEKTDYIEIDLRTTTVSSVRETDKTTVQIPIIVEYPEHKPVSEPEIFDQMISYVTDDDIVETSTLFPEPVTIFTVTPDISAATSSETPVDSTEKAPVFTTEIEVEEKAQPEAATLSYVDHTLKMTTIDDEIRLSDVTPPEKEKYDTTLSQVTKESYTTYTPDIGEEIFDEATPLPVKISEESVSLSPDVTTPHTADEKTTQYLEEEFITLSEAPKSETEMTTKSTVVLEDTKTTVRDTTDSLLEEEEDEHLHEQTTKLSMPDKDLEEMTVTEETKTTFKPTSKTVDEETSENYTYDPLTTKKAELSTEGPFIPDSIDFTTASLTEVDETEKTYDFTTSKSDISSPHERDEITTFIYDKISTEPPTDDEGDVEDILTPEVKLQSTTERVTETKDFTTVTDIFTPKRTECAFNGKVYANGHKVPSSNKCDECICQNGIIMCSTVKCSPPPPAFLRCNVKQTPEHCCPFYDCPIVFPSLEPDKDIEVTTQPKDETDITEGSLLKKEDDSITPTTLSSLFEKEEVTDKTPITVIYPEHTLSVSDPVTLDQTIQNVTDEQISDTILDYKDQTDPPLTTDFVETATSEKTVAFPEVVPEITISYDDDGTLSVISTSPKIVKDVIDKIDDTTLISISEKEDITQAPVTDHKTVTEEIDDYIHKTTVSYIDELYDKTDVSVPEEPTEFPALVSQTEKLDYHETTSVKPTTALDIATTLEIGVTPVSEDDKVVDVTEESIPRNITMEEKTEVEEALSEDEYKSSTRTPDSFLSSPLPTDMDMTTEIPEIMHTTSIIADMTISPGVKLEDLKTTKAPHLLPATTEVTKGEVGIVAEVTTEDSVTELKESEILLPDIFGTKLPSITKIIQPSETVTETMEDTDKMVTTVIPQQNISTEITSLLPEPTTYFFTDDLPTTSKAEDKEVHSTEYTTESISVSELSTSYLLPDIRTSDSDVTKETSTVVVSSSTSEAVVTPDVEVTTGAPGEGLCSSNGNIYFNGEKVPASSPCQEECRCANSIIACKIVKCPPPPEAILRCEVKQNSDECCPVYECPLLFPNEEIDIKYPTDQPPTKPELDMPRVTEAVEPFITQTTKPDDSKTTKLFEQTYETITESPIGTESSTKISTSTIFRTDEVTTHQVITYKPGVEVKETTDEPVDISLQKTKKHPTDTTQTIKTTPDTTTVKPQSLETETQDYTITTLQSIFSIDTTTLSTQTYKPDMTKIHSYESTEKTDITTELIDLHTTPFSLPTVLHTEIPDHTETEKPLEDETDLTSIPTTEEPFVEITKIPIDITTAKAVTVFEYTTTPHKVFTILTDKPHELETVESENVTTDKPVTPFEFTSTLHTLSTDFPTEKPTELDTVQPYERETKPSTFALTKDESTITSSTERETSPTYIPDASLTTSPSDARTDIPPTSAYPLTPEKQYTLVFPSEIKTKAPPTPPPKYRPPVHEKEKPIKTTTHQPDLLTEATVTETDIPLETSSQPLPTEIQTDVSVDIEPTTISIEKDMVTVKMLPTTLSPDKIYTTRSEAPIEVITDLPAIFETDDPADITTEMVDKFVTEKPDEPEPRTSEQPMTTEYLEVRTDEPIDRLSTPEVVPTALPTDITDDIATTKVPVTTHEPYSTEPEDVSTHLPDVSAISYEPVDVTTEKPYPPVTDTPNATVPEKRFHPTTYETVVLVTEDTAATHPDTTVETHTTPFSLPTVLHTEIPDHTETEKPLEDETDLTSIPTTEEPFVEVTKIPIDITTAKAVTVFEYTTTPHKVFTILTDKPHELETVESENVTTDKPVTPFEFTSTLHTLSTDFPTEKPTELDTVQPYERETKPSTFALTKDESTITSSTERETSPTYIPDASLTTSPSDARTDIPPTSAYPLTPEKQYTLVFPSEIKTKAPPTPPPKYRPPVHETEKPIKTTTHQPDLLTEATVTETDIPLETSSQPLPTEIQTDVSVDIEPTTISIEKDMVTVKMLPTTLSPDKIYTTRSEAPKEVITDLPAIFETDDPADITTETVDKFVTEKPDEPEPRTSEQPMTTEYLEVRTDEPIDRLSTPEVVPTALPTDITDDIATTKVPVTTHEPYSTEPEDVSTHLPDVSAISYEPVDVTTEKPYPPVTETPNATVPEKRFHPTTYETVVLVTEDTAATHPDTTVETHTTPFSLPTVLHTEIPDHTETEKPLEDETDLTSIPTTEEPFVEVTKIPIDITTAKTVTAFEYTTTPHKVFTILTDKPHELETVESENVTTDKPVTPFEFTSTLHTLSTDFPTEKPTELDTVQPYERETKPSTFALTKDESTITSSTERETSPTYIPDASLTTSPSDARTDIPPTSAYPLTPEKQYTLVFPSEIKTKAPPTPPPKYRPPVHETEKPIKTTTHQPDLLTEATVTETDIPLETSSQPLPTEIQTDVSVDIEPTTISIEKDMVTVKMLPTTLSPDKIYTTRSEAPIEVITDLPDIFETDDPADITTEMVDKFVTEKPDEPEPRTSEQPMTTEYLEVRTDEPIDRLSTPEVVPTALPTDITDDIATTKVPVTTHEPYSTEPEDVSTHLPDVSAISYEPVDVTTEKPYPPVTETPNATVPEKRFHPTTYETVVLVTEDTAATHPDTTVETHTTPFSLPTVLHTEIPDHTETEKPLEDETDLTSIPTTEEPFVEVTKIPIDITTAKTVTAFEYTTTPHKVFTILTDKPHELETVESENVTTDKPVTPFEFTSTLHTLSTDFPTEKPTELDTVQPYERETKPSTFALTKDESTITSSTERETSPTYIPDASLTTSPSDARTDIPPTSAYPLTPEKQYTLVFPSEIKTKAPPTPPPKYRPPVHETEKPIKTTTHQPDLLTEATVTETDIPLETSSQPLPTEIQTDVSVDIEPTTISIEKDMVTVKMLPTTLSPDKIYTTRSEAPKEVITDLPAIFETDDPADITTETVDKFVTEKPDEPEPRTSEQPMTTEYLEVRTDEPIDRLSTPEVVPTALPTDITDDIATTKVPVTTHEPYSTEPEDVSTHLPDVSAISYEPVDVTTEKPYPPVTETPNATVPEKRFHPTTYETVVLVTEDTAATHPDTTVETHTTPFSLPTVLHTEIPDHTETEKPLEDETDLTSIPTTEEPFVEVTKIPIDITTAKTVTAFEYTTTPHKVFTILTDKPHELETVESENVTTDKPVTPFEFTSTLHTLSTDFPTEKPTELDTVQPYERETKPSTFALTKDESTITSSTERETSPTYIPDASLTTSPSDARTDIPPTSAYPLTPEKQYTLVFPSEIKTKAPPTPPPKYRPPVHETEKPIKTTTHQPDLLTEATVTETDIPLETSSQPLPTEIQTDVSVDIEPTTISIEKDMVTVKMLPTTLSPDKIYTTRSEAPIEVITDLPDIFETDDPADITTEMVDKFVTEKPDEPEPRTSEQPMTTEYLEVRTDEPIDRLSTPEVVPTALPTDITDDIATTKVPVTTHEPYSTEPEDVSTHLPDVSAISYEPVDVTTEKPYPPVTETPNATVPEKRFHPTTYETVVLVTEDTAATHPDTTVETHTTPFSLPTVLHTEIPDHTETEKPLEDETDLTSIPTTEEPFVEVTKIPIDITTAKTVTAFEYTTTPHKVFTILTDKPHELETVESENVTTDKPVTPFEFTSTLHTLSTDFPTEKPTELDTVQPYERETKPSTFALTKDESTITSSTERETSPTYIPDASLTTSPSDARTDIPPTSAYPLTPEKQYTLVFPSEIKTKAPPTPPPKYRPPVHETEKPIKTTTHQPDLLTEATVTETDIPLETSSQPLPTEIQTDVSVDIEPTTISIEKDMVTVKMLPTTLSPDKIYTTRSEAPKEVITDLPAIFETDDPADITTERVDKFVTEKPDEPEPRTSEQPMTTEYLEVRTDEPIDRLSTPEVVPTALPTDITDDIATTKVPVTTHEPYSTEPEDVSTHLPDVSAISYEPVDVTTEKPYPPVTETPNATVPEKRFHPTTYETVVLVTEDTAATHPDTTVETHTTPFSLPTVLHTEIPDHTETEKPLEDETDLTSIPTTEEPFVEVTKIPIDITTAKTVTAFEYTTTPHKVFTILTDKPHELETVESENVTTDKPVTPFEFTSTLHTLSTDFPTEKPTELDTVQPYERETKPSTFALTKDESTITSSTERETSPTYIPDASLTTSPSDARTDIPPTSAYPLTPEKQYTLVFPSEIKTKAPPTPPPKYRPPVHETEKPIKTTTHQPDLLTEATVTETDIPLETSSQPLPTEIQTDVSVDIEPTTISIEKDMVTVKMLPTTLSPDKIYTTRSEAPKEVITDLPAIFETDDPADITTETVDKFVTEKPDEPEPRTSEQPMTTEYLEVRTDEPIDRLSTPEVVPTALPTDITDDIATTKVPVTTHEPYSTEPEDVSTHLPDVSAISYEPVDVTTEKPYPPVTETPNATVPEKRFHPTTYETVVLVTEDTAATHPDTTVETHTTPFSLPTVLPTEIPDHTETEKPLEDETDLTSIPTTEEPFVEVTKIPIDITTAKAVTVFEYTTTPHKVFTILTDKPHELETVESENVTTDKPVTPFEFTSTLHTLSTDFPTEKPTELDTVQPYERETKPSTFALTKDESTITSSTERETSPTYIPDASLTTSPSDARTDIPPTSAYPLTPEKQYTLVFPSEIKTKAPPTPPPKYRPPVHETEKPIKTTTHQPDLLTKATVTETDIPLETSSQPLPTEIQTDVSVDIEPTTISIEKDMVTVKMLPTTLSPDKIYTTRSEAPKEVITDLPAIFETDDPADITTEMVDKFVTEKPDEPEPRTSEQPMTTEYLEVRTDEPIDRLSTPEVVPTALPTDITDDIATTKVPVTTHEPYSTEPEDVSTHLPDVSAISYEPVDVTTEKPYPPVTETPNATVPEKRFHPTTYETVVLVTEDTAATHPDTTVETHTTPFSLPTVLHTEIPDHTETEKPLEDETDLTSIPTTEEPFVEVTKIPIDITTAKAVTVFEYTTTPHKVFTILTDKPHELETVESENVTTDKPVTPFEFTSTLHTLSTDFPTEKPTELDTVQPYERETKPSTFALTKDESTITSSTERETSPTYIPDASLTTSPSDARTDIPPTSAYPLTPEKQYTLVFPSEIKTKAPPTPPPKYRPPVHETEKPIKTTTHQPDLLTEATVTETDIPLETSSQPLPTEIQTDVSVDIEPTTISIEKDMVTVKMLPTTLSPDKIYTTRSETPKEVITDLPAIFETDDPADITTETVDKFVTEKPDEPEPRTSEQPMTTEYLEVRTDEPIDRLSTPEVVPTALPTDITDDIATTKVPVTTHEPYSTEPEDVSTHLPDVSAISYEPVDVTTEKPYPPVTETPNATVPEKRFHPTTYETVVLVTEDTAATHPDTTVETHTTPFSLPTVLHTEIPDHTETEKPLEDETDLTSIPTTEEPFVEVTKIPIDITTAKAVTVFEYTTTPHKVFTILTDKPHELETVESENVTTDKPVTPFEFTSTLHTLSTDFPTEKPTELDTVQPYERETKPSTFALTKDESTITSSTERETSPTYIPDASLTTSPSDARTDIPPTSAYPLTPEKQYTLVFPSEIKTKAPPTPPPKYRPPVHETEKPFTKITHQPDLLTEATVTETDIPLETSSQPLPTEIQTDVSVDIEPTTISTEKDIVTVKMLPSTLSPDKIYTTRSEAPKEVITDLPAIFETDDPADITTETVDKFVTEKPDEPEPRTSEQPMTTEYLEVRTDEPIDRLSTPEVVPTALSTDIPDDIATTKVPVTTHELYSPEYEDVSTHLPDVSAISSEPVDVTTEKPYPPVTETPNATVPEKRFHLTTYETAVLVTEDTAATQPDTTVETHTTPFSLPTVLHTEIPDHTETEKPLEDETDLTSIPTTEEPFVEVTKIPIDITTAKAVTVFEYTTTPHKVFTILTDKPHPTLSSVYKHVTPDKTPDLITLKTPDIPTHTSTAFDFYTDLPTDEYTDSPPQTSTSELDMTIDFSTHKPGILGTESTFVPETPKPTEVIKELEATTETVTEKPYADDPQMPLDIKTPEPVEFGTILPDSLETKLPFFTDKPSVHSEFPFIQLNDSSLLSDENETSLSTELLKASTVSQEVKTTQKPLLMIASSTFKTIDAETSTTKREETVDTEEIDLEAYTISAMDVKELITTLKSTTTDVTSESLTTVMTEEPALNVSTTQFPSVEVSVSQATPIETIVKEIERKTERPFPPFPGHQDQSYFPPVTTTKKPTTAAEVILGPGSCLFDGKIYVSAQQIPRDNPCDFCFCFRGDIICLQQSCPPPIPGCYEEAIAGFCCPRYECPVRQTVMNITTTTKSPFPGFPPSTKTSRVNMCEIDGKFYASGARVDAASTPCLNCLCGDDGSMKCYPQECPSNRKVYKKHGYR